MAGIGKPGPAKEPGPRDSRGRLIRDIDTGPDARWQGKTPFWVEEFSEVEGRNRPVTRRRLRVMAECALDALQLNGALGTGEEAEGRYKAGEWLRALHCRLHPTASAMRFDDAGRGKAEMSDRQAWNFKVYNDEIRAMGQYAPVVMKVCCHDSAMVDLKALWRGLDILAERRGIKRATERFHHDPVDEAPKV